MTSIKHSIIQNSKFYIKICKSGNLAALRLESLNACIRSANFLISDPSRKIVVLSALSGSTNALIAIGEAAKAFDDAKAAALIEDLKTHYGLFIKELYATCSRPCQWSNDRGQ
ncbi:hypothetical protein PEC18_19800 [Paucibacter sp. O1-1]|nr:hypothetical protein [Paucibacter sp. O1-1]MDA3828011.1 hypothetical protein [Paucibacter sp. O1-1]